MEPGNVSPSPALYRGRFAPTPSGPLHFGSLVAALASWLDARAHGGQWLLRIEDIDPPRCQPDAVDQIHQCLLHHGLQPDGSLIFQSTHGQRYDQALQHLHQQGHTYYCECTRAQIKQQGGHDNIACRGARLEAADHRAIRFVSKGVSAINDLVQSFDSLTLAQDDESKPLTLAQDDESKPLTLAQDDESKRLTLAQDDESKPLTLAQDGDTRAALPVRDAPDSSALAADDPVLKRRDGLYGYPLAVAVDDLAEGYTHIIRGADLLDFTPLQCEIILALGGKPPEYGHIPVVTNRDGLKLSKQNHALPLSGHNARENLLNALAFLGQRLDKAAKADSIDALLNCAVHNWRRERIPRLPSATWPPNSC